MSVELVLTTLSRDHLEVSRALSGFDANIEELHTETYTGSMGGEAMFSVNAKIVLPDTLNTEDVRSALEQIAHDIMVDIELEDTGE